MKSELLQKKALLGILLILLIAKFVFVPLFTWQKEQVDVLQKNQQRLAKSSAVIANESQLHNALQVVERQLKEFNELVWSYAEEADFRFSSQKKLTALTEQFQLEVDNIGWLTRLEIPEAGLTRHQLNITVSGNTVNIQKFLNNLEAQQSKISIRQFKVSYLSQDEASLGRSQCNLLLSLYMHQQEVE